MVNIRKVFYWALRVLFFKFFPLFFKVFLMMLNVSREFMFWAVVCALNQCCAFTGWEQNVLWYLLQLKCLSITTSHLPQAWQRFFGGLPRRFLISQLCAEEKGFLYLILEMCFFGEHKCIFHYLIHRCRHRTVTQRISQRGRRICRDAHIYLWGFFSKMWQS